jgi:DNA-binding response OmpR family regulator
VIILRLLLIEDEKGLADSLSAILKKENYIVDYYSDGESGLYAALSNIYDVIILDVMLPKLNGFEVLKRLRNEKISTPVLNLTAKCDISDMVTGLDFGADDYLTKPFIIEELLARLRALCRRQGEIIPDALTFSNMELDLSKCLLMCTTTGKSINISQKELQLLEILMINKHQVLTKEQLTVKIWGFDSQTEYNNVEVYISFIRKKISFIGAATKIKAVRGIGYILEEENV